MGMGLLFGGDLVAAPGDEGAVDAGSAQLDEESSDGPVTVERIRGDGVPGVRIVATRPGVFLPDCRAVGWERFDESRGLFEAMPGPSCGPEGAAVTLAQEGVEVRFDGKVDAPLVVRAVVVYGLDCEAGVPLARGGCSELGYARGPNLSLRPLGQVSSP